MTDGDENAEVAKVLKFRDEVVASLTKTYGHLVGANTDELAKLAPEARAEAHRFRRWALDLRVRKITEQCGRNPMERLVAGKLYGLPRELITDSEFDTKVLGAMTAKPEFARRASRGTDESHSSSGSSNSGSSSSDGSSDEEDSENAQDTTKEDEEEVVLVKQTGGLPNAAQLGPPPNLPAKPMSQLNVTTAEIRQKLLLLKRKQQQQQQQQQQGIGTSTTNPVNVSGKRTRDYDSDNDDDYQPELKKDIQAQSGAEEEDEDDYVPSLGSNSKATTKHLKKDIAIKKNSDDKKENDDSSSNSSSCDSDSSDDSNTDSDSSSDSSDSSDSESDSDSGNRETSSDSDSSSSSSGEESDYEPTITSVTNRAPPLKQEPPSQPDFFQPQQYQQQHQTQYQQQHQQHQAQYQQQFQQIPFNSQQQPQQYTQYYNPAQLPPAPIPVPTSYMPFQAPQRAGLVPPQPGFYAQQQQQQQRPPPPLLPPPQPYQVQMHYPATQPKGKPSKKQNRYNNRYNKRPPNPNPGPGPSFGDDGLSGLY